MIRHYIEIRGVGVIDVQRLFGMSAVQHDSEVGLVVSAPGGGGGVVVLLRAGRGADARRVAAAM